MVLNPSLYEHDLVWGVCSERNGPARVAAQAGPPIVGSCPSAALRAAFVAGSRSVLHRTRMVEGTLGSHHKEGSSKMSQHSMVCAGIDTGKYKLDVALNGSREQLQIDNTADGHAALSIWLKRHKVQRVGIEASGGYEQNVVARLRHDKFVVVVFQPAQVRAYARFLLQRAKNDKIDAALIAACTAATKKIHAPPDPRLAPLAERMTLIDQLTDQIARFKNYREGSRDGHGRQFWKEQIALFNKQIRTELKELVAAIGQHRDLAERLALIESVDGVGLGRLTREQAASLSGLAP